MQKVQRPSMQIRKLSSNSSDKMDSDPICLVQLAPREKTALSGRSSPKARSRERRLRGKKPSASCREALIAPGKRDVSNLPSFADIDEFFSFFSRINARFINAPTSRSFFIKDAPRSASITKSAAKTSFRIYVYIKFWYRDDSRNLFACAKLSWKFNALICRRFKIRSWHFTQ